MPQLARYLRMAGVVFGVAFLVWLMWVVLIGPAMVLLITQR